MCAEPVPAPAAGPVEHVAFSSHDEEEVTDFVRRQYAENHTRFEVVHSAASFNVRAALAAGLAADRLRSTIDFTVRMPTFEEFAFISVGRGRVRMAGRGDETLVLPGGAAVYPLGVELEFEVHDSDNSGVRLPVARLREVAREASGLDTAQLDFDGTRPVSAARERAWVALVDLVSVALMDPDSPMGHPLLAQEVIRTVALTALHTFPNATMTQVHVPGPGWVAPMALRRAVAHIEQWAHRPLTLTDLAAAAGTTPRALQYAFRRHYDTTPTAYLRRVRLERAHHELTAADPASGVTVAAVARRWGFSRPGHFTAVYRAVYKTLPSHTLRT